MPHDNPLSKVASIQQERRSISALNPAAYNPRKRLMPGDHEYEKLKQSIEAFGYVDPIIVNMDGTVIGGHQRLNVLKDLGFQEVDVAVVNLDKNEEKALNIALNKISGEWDEEKLEELLAELTIEGFPIELTGFSETDLEDILSDIIEGHEEEPQAPDEEHDQPLPPMSQPGDLWMLGPHRLICGDATDEPTIERLMDGEKAAMVHTDPPYGVSYETQSGNFAMIKNDDKTHDDLFYTLLLPAFNNYRKHTIPQAAFYIWHASSTRRDFEDAMVTAGLVEKQYIIWVKNGITLGRSDYQWAHEPCFYAAKDGETPNFYGDRAQHTVWRATTRQDGSMMTVLGSGIVLTDGTGGKLCITDKPPKGKKLRYIRMEPGDHIDLFQEDRMKTVWEVARETNPLHPTQKPVEIPTRAIENSSQPGDIVLDFFGGSGSTLMGAELTGRRCFSTELDPVYCDVIISRYVSQTGNLGVTCIRDGKELPYIDLVREWAKAAGEEERINSMKIPVVVTKKIVEAAVKAQDDACGGE
ncbi:MAG: site-specific DNA-methyltransferase [Faecousia sp.]